MSVVRITETWSGRSGAWDESLNRQFTRNFRVRTNDERDGPLIVGSAVGIPRIGDSYVSHNGRESDAGSLCRRLSLKQLEEDPKVWDVTCEYDTLSSLPGADDTGTSGGDGGQVGGGGETGSGLLNDGTGYPGGLHGSGGGGTKPNPVSPDGTGGDGGGGGSGGSGGNSPETRPPTVRWGFQETTKPFRRAYGNGGASPLRTVPVVNAAGQPFDPLPEVESGYITLEITRIQLSYDPQLAVRFAYAVNAEKFLFADPGYAQCLPITADQEWISGRLYYSVNYRFRFREDETWQAHLLNCGYREKDGSGKLKDIIVGQSREPVKKPWPLDAAGKAIPPDTTTSVDPEEWAVYLEFAAFRKLQFSELNLNIVIT